MTEELQRMFRKRIQGGGRKIFRFLEVAFLPTGARHWLANENASNPARRFIGIYGLRQFPGDGGGNIPGNDMDASLGNLTHQLAALPDPTPPRQPITWKRYFRFPTDCAR